MIKNIQTWRDIEIGALNDPILRHLIAQVENGMTREEALIHVVLWIAGRERERINIEVERLSNAIPCKYCGTNTFQLKIMLKETPEQIAREMLYRMGIKDALSWSSGEVLLLANLIADYRRLGGEI